MCSIIGSFSEKKIMELVEKNQHRGKVAYSLASFERDGSHVKIVYGEGEFDPKIFRQLQTDGRYMVCHLQSPTNTDAADTGYRQPSVITGSSNTSYLWHNGILMPQTMEMISQVLGIESRFDTHLLHHWLEHNEALDKIEGSFACVYMGGDARNIKIFRSRHAKLYVDLETMTMSSERFDGSRCINADRVYDVDLVSGKLSIASYFKTKHFNINIKGELDD
jgi:glutamine phosphoribosylpyrophosphate amidotransferase